RTYAPRSPDGSTFLLQLFRRYRTEGFPMPYTLADLRRDAKEELLAEMTPEERLEGVPMEKRLEGIPAAGRIQGLSDAELEAMKELIDKKLKKPDVES
ncbi:MAG: hypothetical protein K2W96_03845, partial [Gemmataceae bacterium]|nr:hypothetical protein [Gemmataceae bacterium]